MKWQDGGKGKRERSRYTIKRICKICGKDFPATRRDAEYCSALCRKRKQRMTWGHEPLGLKPGGLQAVSAGSPDPASTTPALAPEGAVRLHDDSPIVRMF